MKSMKLDLHTLGVDIASFLQRNEHRFATCTMGTKRRECTSSKTIEWDANIHYALSRETDLDDSKSLYGVAQLFFNFMDSIWGPHSVDRFADNLNAKLCVFNSKYWCPNTSQVDSFAVSWEKENLVSSADIPDRSSY